MTTLERLEGWRRSGAIREEQYTAIASLVRKQRFSVFLELNILLYLGVISFVAGAGWTIRAYFASLGDVAIIGSLSLLVGASFYYCFTHANPYSSLQVESPNLGFDYILYLGCLLLGVELGYLETQFHLLDTQWDYYLLFSALVFFACAYRFDNRFVLSLAMTTLAAWFGIRTSRFYLFHLSVLRPAAMAYSATTATAGLSLYRARIKKHFLETYLHISANVLMATLLSGIEEPGSGYLMAMLIASGVSIWGGIRFRRFAFVAYGVVYGYLAISIEVLRNNRDFVGMLTYIFLSGAMVLVGLILLARRIGREP